MKNTKLVLSLVLAGFVTLFVCTLRVNPVAPKSVPVQTPTGNSTQRPDEHFIAALDVARVFGRAPGCSDAPPDFIVDVADTALRAKLDPRLFAATVAVESACNQFATSSKGAIGLTMVVPKVWKDTYDFEKRFNLFNRKDNLEVGAAILSKFVQQYGASLGLRHYNGMAAASPDYDVNYTNKIELLAGRGKAK